jgi:putative tryptophan/tyrosine transport system substrate-binding protein
VTAPIRFMLHCMSPLSGVKRTCPSNREMSASDPKRTLPLPDYSAESLRCLVLSLGGSMRRREFIAGLGGVTAMPFAVRAQQSATPVIGFVQSGSAGPTAHLAVAFFRGLKEAGYVEGQNVGIIYRYAEGQYHRLPELVADLLKRQVALIGAFGPPAAQAAKAATITVPIVFTSVDPVKFGLVASLNKPGGNATGAHVLTIDLEGKRLEMLSGLVPALAPIGVLINPDSEHAEGQTKEVQAGALRIGRRIVIVNANSERDINSAFRVLVERGAAGLLIAADPFFFGRREQLATLAAYHAMPAIYEWREYVLAGGLMSHGSDIANSYRQAGVYAGRILKGEKPSDLPVVQPTKFDLVINLKTAKALGLTVPEKLLALAGEVIE